MKLKFIADAYYRGEHVHKKGDVVEISNEKGMADRWLKRNVAVEFEGEAKKEVAPKKEEIKDEFPSLDEEQTEEEPVKDEELSEEEGKPAVKGRRTRKSK